jgi:hypothetical protein
VQTLDQVCEFLGVSTGVVGEVPVANVTTEASHSTVNSVLRSMVRRAASFDHRLPKRLRRSITLPAERLLQREQELRRPLTTRARAELIPAFESDIALLEEITHRSFDHWRDLRNGVVRQPLEVTGRFGTAHRSIDRPLET